VENTGNSTEAAPIASMDERAKAEKKLVEELKVEWKKLWTERFDDKQRAEGVSAADYRPLRVERGTIIHATRDFKALNFREILEQHRVESPERFVQPDPHVGGWNKFIKNEITVQKPDRHRRAAAYVPEKKAVQQPKKGGRGWLHST